MRKTPLVSGEIYHIYNRGVDKRDIFADEADRDRFYLSLQLFNTKDPIGSVYEQMFEKSHRIIRESQALVEFIAYCLNHNHFHLLIKQNIDGGISEFMKRVSGGYTWYFNNRHDRSGVLFQGRFKSRHINTNAYLLHVSAYVNLNDRVHQLGGSTAKLVQSSWDEYRSNPLSKRICTGKDVILEQFSSSDDYGIFATNALVGILEKKKEERELADILID